ncbi:MAG: hypothetical protein ACPG6B_09020 [Oceanihabitans sp.]
MKITRTLLLISIALLALLLFRTCDANNCSLNEQEVISTYVDSRHTITMQQTKELQLNYKNRFIPEIKKLQEDPGNGEVRPDYLPTEYSLIPLQKLKDYINFLEVLQEKNPNQTITGVAINFGAYNLNKSATNKSKESAEKDPKQKGDYRGRMTTFFTPTFYNGEIDSEYDAEKHTPFYIDYDDESDKFKGTFVALDTYTQTSTGELQNNLSNKANTKVLEASSIPNFISMLKRKSTKKRANAQSAAMNEFTDMPPKRSGN